MKLSKKLLAIALAVLMLAAFATTVFADDPAGSITIVNPVEGTSYTAYQIFNATLSEDGKIAYTIDANSPWFDAVDAYAGIELTQVRDTDTYVVKEGASFNAAVFADKLKDALAAMEEKPEGTAIEDKTEVDLGYWFVTTSVGSVFSLDSANPDAKIFDKNNVPFSKELTSQDDASVQLGDVISYTVTGNVPSTLGFASYTYKIADTLSGADLDVNSFVVTIGGVDVTKADAVTIAATTSSFTLDIDMDKYQDQVGAELVVTYKATVTSDALEDDKDGKVTNSATLTYNNDPTSTETTTTNPEIVTSTIYSVEITKVDGKDDQIKLKGASFVLQNGDDKYYTYDAKTDAVVWVEKIEDADVMTTDDKGIATFEGIQAGDYKLIETVAPAGYNLPKDPFDVTVGAEGDGAVVSTTIANNAGAILPATGGFGTKMLILVGTVLFGATAIVLVTKKRMYNED